MTAPAPEQIVHDEPAEQRYRLSAGGHETAYAYYDLTGDVMTFTHTVVPPDRQGEGIGTRLIEGALADVRRRGLEIVPQCPFVAAYVNAHPEAQELLAAD